MINFTLKYILPLLLITVLCVFGVKAFYRLAEQRLAAVGAEPEISSGVPVAAAKSAVVIDGQVNGDTSVITRRNLFASKEDSVAEEEAIDLLAAAEPTKLGFVLMGTAIDAENDNRAFIYDKKKRKQEMYREGDDLQGAIIRQISYGKVIITVDGKNELLDIAEARKVNLPKVKKPVPVTTARQVQGRPVSGDSSRAQRPKVQRPTGAAGNPNAAIARQIRIYRGRTSAVTPETAPTAADSDTTPRPAEKADTAAATGAAQ